MSLDKDIRIKIKEYILEVDPSAKVFAFDTLSLDPRDWANLFKQTISNVTKTNGWVIKRNSFTSSEIRGNTFADVYAYDIWGYHQFNGKSETDNSDDIFQAVIDGIIEKFKLNMTLKLSCVKEHKVPQFPNITVIESGEDSDEPLHFAQGKLEVHLCPRVAGQSC